MTTILMLAASMLYNADMSATDGIGTPLAWNAKIGCTPSAFAVRSYEVPDGPEGRPARVFSFASPDGKTYLKQHPFELAAGETYRMSAWVRTSHLTDDVWFGFWNYGWTLSTYTEPFPADTAGRWHKVEWTGPMVTGRPTGYSFGLCGSTGTDPAAKLEICDLRFEPVSEKAVAVSKYGSDVVPKPCPVRIVPIDPKLAELATKKATLTFYWPDAVETKAKLVATVDGRECPAAGFDARCRARVELGDLAEGPHKLSVKTVDGQGRTLRQDEYRGVAVVPSKGPAGVKLNNFVTRLHAGDLADGVVRYHRPKAGWTWISFDDAQGDVEGFIDFGTVPIIHRRSGESRIETMRYQKAGWHQLRIVGARGGRVRVHAVKTLGSAAWLLKNYDIDYDLSLGFYRHPSSFYKRYFYGLFNTMSPYNWHEDEGSRDDESNGFFAERGMRICPEVVIPALDPDRLSAERLYSRITARQAFQEGCNIGIDETGITHVLSRACHVYNAEVIWRLARERPRQSISYYLCDAPGAVYEDPVPQTTFISSVINSGGGTGFIAPEVYSAPQTNLAVSIEKGEGHFRRFAKSIKDMVPGATDSILYHFATYINLGSWCDYPNPETDIKFHYDHFIRTLATDPAFASTLGGLSRSAFPHGEEEVLRWLSRVVRHYCLEGGTDDLSEKYGFTLVPGIVRNCDFARGLDGWTASPAEDGGVVALKVENYGRDIQKRKKAEPGTGDGLAVFTSSEKGPNKISQRVAGLVPGRYYSLMYCTVDYDDLMNRRGAKPEIAALRASMDGCTEEKEFAFVHRRYHGGGKDKTVPLQLVVNRQVFRADAKSATLTFSDRAFDGSAEKPGTRRGLNYIIFRPYYNEGEEEIAFLRDMLRPVKKK